MAIGLLVVLAAVSAAPALAHTGDGLSGGFIGGFGHPLFGPDHVAAMVAVGLWGAFLGTPAIWLLPIVFPLVMALGECLEFSASRCPASRSASRPRPSCSA
jgi:urease accessory protein